MSVTEPGTGDFLLDRSLHGSRGHSRRNEWVYIAYKTLSLSVVDRAIFMLFLIYKGFDPFQIGVLQSVFFIANMVAEVPSGLFGDAFGRKRSVMLGLGTYCIFAIGVIVCDGFASFLVLYALLGLALALVYGSDTALIYDSLAADGRAEEFNRVQLRANALGLMSGAVAVLAGGALQILSWDAVYVGYLIVNLAAIAVWCFAIEPIAVRRPDGRSDVSRQLRDYIRGNWRRIGLPILGFTVFAASTTPFLTFSQALFNEQGISVQTITWFFCGSQILIGVVYVILQRRMALLGFYPVLLVTTAMTSVLLALLFLNIPAITFGTFLLAMVFSPIVTIVANNYFNVSLPSGVRASFLSLIGICMSAAIAVMYYLYGYMTESMPLHKVMAWTAVVPVLAFAIFVLSARIEMARSRP
ncbi:MAG: MFS transporter [Pseudomonadota bacterium]|nr:MFS transporter [Pseudomonadota bacterium]